MTMVLVGIVKMQYPNYLPEPSKEKTPTPRGLKSNVKAKKIRIQ